MKSPKEKIQLLALREAVDDPMEDAEDLKEAGKALDAMFVCPKCGHEGPKSEFEE